MTGYETYVLKEPVESTPPSAAANNVLSALAIFFGAFLLFQLEPIITKMILPWFGGSAVVWTVCMLFFQSALLAGYAYAHWLSSRTGRGAHYVHIALLAASLLLLPIYPASQWKPDGSANPLPRILGLLTVTVGLPYFLLSCTSPLVQTWCARRSGSARPYRFFALSNFGSLLALLSYPVLVEPWISARIQGVVWSCSYAALAVLLGWLAYRNSGQAPAAPVTPKPQASHAPLSVGQRLVWIILAACASFLLLATTNHLSQNIAVVPFLWILPLSVYLLSFILCFDHERWYRREIVLPLYAATLALAGYLLVHEVPGDRVLPHIAVYSAALFFACMMCHGELALRKPPAEHLTQFYLTISLGGTIGSVLVALAAPVYFKGIYEFSVGLAACGMLTLMLYLKKSIWTDLVWTCLAVWLFVAAGAQMQAYSNGALLTARSFYGSLRVMDTTEPGTDLPERILIHGAISHGMQLQRPDLRREPTGYYARSSGIGMVLRAMGDRPLQVGVIGLGAGTMAAYGRPGDEYRFYELDPLIIEVARRDFTFIADSEAHVATIAGDGRLALAREAGRRFDVLAVDAFSGDSIPVHLLSLEAFRLYFQRLAPGGVLAIHVSNSFLNLAPVVATAAERLGKTARIIEVQEDHQFHQGHSLWAVLAEDPATLDRLLAPGTGRTTPVSAHLRAWTDDYSNLFQIIK